MNAFLIGVLVAVAQVILLKLLIDALTYKRGKRAFLIFTVKFLLYGCVIALLGFKLNGYIENACYGFVAAFPLSAIVWFVLGIFKQQIKKILSVILSKIKKPRS